ncbi:peptidoglycan-binding domain-containing protein [Bacillus sp. REN16]|uniref:peptidoglycan-binding domain-containing protein n=1 Tax=Bacillus sp. REN16 TaxID=2887296 RepID=UPI001E5214C4|nr:peptidoglycan-binding domain-containing protein [Bacillus sp. REN16]MCC3359623.1 peptidoglycan-binding protein [Bacillus sp. REN16]
MVKLIHFFLTSLGYTQVKHVEIDEFQDFTEDAVKRFQRDQKLTKPTPGVVDFETFSAFAKVLHVYYKDRLK